MITLSPAKRATVALALAGCIAVGVAYVAGAARTPSAAVAAPPATDFVRIRTTNSVDLTNAVGVSNAATVVKVTVPAGSWVLSATDDVVNFGSPDYVRCAVQSAPGTAIGGVTTTVGNQSASSYVAALATIAPVKSNTSFTAALVCWRDGQGGAPYVDPNAVLWVHQSPNLDSATQ